MREIQAIMRQIASSITYLPCLDEPCRTTCISFCFSSSYYSFNVSFISYLSMAIFFQVFLMC